MSKSDLGVVSRADDPAAVAATRSFYVAPNNQLAMSNSFIVGQPLNKVFADRIATKLASRGLQQAPPDMADVIVVFTVQDPNASSANGGGNTQGLAYADQLLNEAKGLETKDNFLDNDRLDFRIRMVSSKSQKPIWRGSVAGVMPASQGSRGRLMEVLNAVDRLLEQYPKVK